MLSGEYCMSTGRFRATFFTLKKLVLNPDAAFADIKQSGHFFILFNLILIAMCLVQIVYMLQVDPTWYSNYATRLLTNSMAPDQIASMKKLYQPKLLIYVQPVIIFIGFSIFWSLEAVYLLIISNIKNRDIIFSEWFALIVWSSAPQLLVSLFSLFNLALGDNRYLPQDSINPINFSHLFSIAPSSPLYATFASSSIFTLWSLYLLIRGVKQWMSTGWSGAILIILAPFLVLGYLFS